MDDHKHGDGWKLKTRFAAQIAACRPEDFSGLTEFNTMSPSQRLDALASMARFVAEWKGIASSQVGGQRGRGAKAESRKPMGD